MNCMQLDYLTTHTSLSPIQRGFAAGFVNYKIGCTRLAAASDKVQNLHAHGRWFSPGSPASSSTKTGRHNIAEILLKVALNTKNQSINQSIIQLKGKVWDHKTSLTLPLFIERPVPRKWSCLCVLEVQNSPLFLRFCDYILELF